MCSVCAQVSGVVLEPCHTTVSESDFKIKSRFLSDALLRICF